MIFWPSVYTTFLWYKIFPWWWKDKGIKCNYIVLQDGVWWRGRVGVSRTTRREKASSSPVFRRASLSHSEWDIRRWGSSTGLLIVCIGHHGSNVLIYRNVCVLYIVDFITEKQHSEVRTQGNVQNNSVEAEKNSLYKDDLVTLTWGGLVKKAKGKHWTFQLTVKFISLEVFRSEMNLVKYNSISSKRTVPHQFSFVTPQCLGFLQIRCERKWL